MSKNSVVDSEVVPVFVWGPKLEFLRFGVDPMTGVPTAECPACGAKSVANIQLRVTFLQHREGCPLFADGETGLQLQQELAMNEQTIRTEADAFVDSGTSPPENGVSLAPPSQGQGGVPNRIQELKKRFVHFVECHQPATFAEVVQAFPEEKGDSTPRLVLFPSILLWIGLSKELVEAIRQSIEEELVSPRPVSLLLYLYEGHALTLPLATELRHYKSDRWLPVAFSTTKRGIDPDAKPSTGADGGDVEARGVAA